MKSLGRSRNVEGARVSGAHDQGTSGARGAEKRCQLVASAEGRNCRSSGVTPASVRASLSALAVVDELDREVKILGFH
jgi:hypothetical protein